MNWRERRTLRRIQRRAAGIRTPMEFPVPQPTTLLRGNVVEITFDSYHAAGEGTGDPAILKLFATFGKYRVKPKRNSRGVVWNNRAFWWSAKGYYRGGKDREHRQLLQHSIWEHHHQRSVSKGHEIFFRDRDHHNFQIENLELLSKADLHQRCFELGEVPQISDEERTKIAGRRWARQSRNMVSSLLKTNVSESSLATNLRRTK